MKRRRERFKPWLETAAGVHSAAGAERENEAIDGERAQGT